MLWQSIRATKNDLSDGDNLPEGLSLEIRKFEVRLREYVEAEEKAAESLKTLIEKLKELNSFMETLPTEKNSEMLDRIYGASPTGHKSLQGSIKLHKQG